MSIVLGLACCGLALDIGMIEVYRIKMQNAADAAALAGQVSHDQEDANWITNGQQDAQQNGFTDQANGVTVSVYQGPTGGLYSADYDAVEATITKSFQPIFLGSKMTISAKAASLESPCIFATGAYSPAWTSYPITLQLTSSIGRFTGSTMGCPVYYNKGLTMDPTSSLWENSFVSSGSAAASNVAGAVNPHQPRYLAPSVTDPLSYLTQPTAGACIDANTSVNLIGVTKTLAPGTYCKTLTFLNSTITLSPGLYIMCNGANWTNSTVTGNGVTLFFTQAGDGKYGQFIATRSTLTLSAPVDSSNGGTPGMLFWADRNWTPTAAQDFQFLFGYGPIGDGIYYTVNTGILFNANTVSGTHYLCFDTDNLNLIATALQPMSNFTVLAGGNPFKSYIGGLVQ
jgi:hypothetical protein